MKAVSVGGLSFSLPLPPSGEPEPHLMPFLVDDSSPEIRCSGRLGAFDPTVERHTVFDSSGVWRVDQLADGIELVLRAGRHPGRPFHTLTLNASNTQGYAILDVPERRNGTRPFLLSEPMLELWTSFLLMQGRGLLVHGCGVLCHGKVHLFVGPSGAGKSTLARVLSTRGRGTILSDDRLVVRPLSSHFEVYGTPWHGEAQFASPLHGALARINFLVQADHSRRVRMLAHQAAALLFQSCFMAGWPRTGLASILKMCTDVVEQIPCYTLYFRPDESAIRAAGLEDCS